MKVKIANMGWNKAPDCIEYLMPSGWYRYLCIAANGIVAWVNTTQFIPDGEYDLKDEDWSYDNPRWDKEADQVCEEIEVA